MTPINMEAALNLPLLEPAPYHAGPKLEASNCFDGHLQRASSTQPADQNSPSRSNLSNRSAASASRSDNSEAGQSNINDRPAAEGCSDDINAPARDDVDKETINNDQVDNAGGPIGAGVVENEPGDGSEASDDEQDESSIEAAELARQAALAAAGASQSQFSLEEAPAGEETEGESDVATDSIEGTAKRQVETHAPPEGQTATAERAVQAEIAGQQATEGRASTDKASQKPVLKLKKTQPAKSKPAEQAASEQQPVIETAVAQQEGVAEPEPDRDRSRKPRGSRGNNPDNNSAAAKVADNGQPRSARLADAAHSRAELAQAAAAVAVASNNQDSSTTNLASNNAQSMRAEQSATAKPTAAPADNAQSPGQRPSLGTSPSKTQSGSNISEVDRVRFVQRVARAVQSAGDRGGAMRLRLSPPELGSLRLEVTVKNGTMSARIEAESASARSLLLDNLPELKQRLAEQQIKVERFDVDLMGQNSNELPQQSESRSQPRTPVTQSSRGRSRGAVEPATRTVASAPVRLPGSGQLNIIV